MKGGLLRAVAEQQEGSVDLRLDFGRQFSIRCMEAWCAAEPHFVSASVCSGVSLREAIKSSIVAKSL